MKGQKMIEQTCKQKLAEIQYRDRLVEQEVLNTIYHYGDKTSNIDELITEWINPQLNDLKRIINVIGIEKGSKMLELGSEYSFCSSSLVCRD